MFLGFGRTEEDIGFNVFREPRADKLQRILEIDVSPRPDTTAQ
jgi:hypothetical protein